MIIRKAHRKEAKIKMALQGVSGSGKTYSALLLAKEGLDIANERYNHNFSLFQTGQTTLTELDLAQREKDQANINVVNANRQFWVAHYLLRRSTLYDFAAGKRID